MLRCLSRYRNAALGIYVEAGEILSLDAETEGQLRRDSPGSFVVIPEGRKVRGLDAPPRHRMMEREVARRKESERQPGPVMNVETHRALTRR